MRMRSLFFALLTYAGTTLSFADPSYLSIKLSDGTYNSFLLSNSPQISYTADSLKVNGALATSYLLSDVDYYHFSETDLSEVPMLKNNETRVSFKDDRHLKIEGLSNGSEVVLYSLTGIILEQSRADSNGTVEIELPVEQGIYILNANNKSIKIVKE